MLRSTALALALLVAGCVPSAAIQQCRDNIAANKGYLTKFEEGSKPHRIAYSNWANWVMQEYNLTGDKPEGFAEAEAWLKPDEGGGQ